MAREKGMEISRARNEVKRVPTRKGSAPKLPVTGSQVFRTKKEGPKAVSEGSEYRTRLRKMAASKTTIARAERRMII
jgi:hypothetical protein